MRFTVIECKLQNELVRFTSTESNFVLVSFLSTVRKTESKANAQRAWNVFMDTRRAGALSVLDK